MHRHFGLTHKNRPTNYTIKNNNYHSKYKFP